MKEGWEIKKLLEICELSAGGDVPKNDYSKTKNQKHNIPIYANGEKNNGLYGYTSTPKITKPSITVSARGTIGFTVKRLENFYPVVRLIVVTPKDLEILDLSYLEYALKTLDFIHSGTSIPQLTVPMIRDYKIPLPPLPEQQRIVSILDECFSVIERSRNNAEKNLQNAKELFESYLHGVFDPSTRSGQGEGWEIKSWDDVLEIRSGRNQKEVEDSNGKYPILGSAGKIMGYANNFICEEGTTIIGRKGTINSPMFIEEKFWNVDTAFGLHAKESLDKRFLHYFCLSFNFLEMDRGSGRPSLVKSDLLKIEMAVPSLEIQKGIVLQLDTLRTETQKLETLYQKKIVALDELKKSILQKAFQGELETEKEKERAV